MPITRNGLVVVADGEHARFIRPASDSALHTQTTIDSTTAHQRSAEIGTDHPGAHFHSQSSTHHSAPPRHDLHETEKKKFAHRIADAINSAASSGEFDDLVLAAPSHVLTEIREALDQAAATKLIGELARDLIKVPDHELQPHLHEWVRPPRRAK